MFLKNKNIIFKIRRSKATDYAALKAIMEVYGLGPKTPYGKVTKTQENITYTRAKVSDIFEQVIKTFIYTLTRFVRAVKALTRLCGCADLSEPSLLAYAISTKGSHTAPQFDVYELPINCLVSCAKVHSGSLTVDPKPGLGQRCLKF